MIEKIHYLIFNEEEITSPCKKGDLFTLNRKKISCKICKKEFNL